jgi:HAUS augmin-like complex subunit 1
MPTNTLQNIVTRSIHKDTTRKQTHRKTQTMNAPPLPPSTPLEYSLFSPSKAAEQQRLAKDWTYIHSFLAAKYPFPSRVPKFEENEETLKALLQLAAWNEKGDEGWMGMCAVEGEVVRGMEEEEEEKVSFMISF